MATVLQLSDTHLTADGRPSHDRDPAERLAAVLDAWRATGRRADLVLVTGDVSDDGSGAACRAAAGMVAALGVPVLAVPGNHDRPDEVADAFGTDAEAEVGGWRVVGVDSVLPDRVEGAVDAGAVLDRLDALDDRPTVVAVHHPPWSHSTHRWFRAAGGEELLAGLAARPHVRAVLSGHLHEPFSVSWDGGVARDGGLALLGAPSTLYAIRHTGDTWEQDPSVPVGGQVVELGGDGTVSGRLLAPAGGGGNA